MQKNCYRCKAQKNLSEFHKDSRKKDGVRASCKECLRKGSDAPRIVPASEFVKVPITKDNDPINDQDNVFDALSLKLQTHYSISVNERFARLQAHYKGHTRTWRGETVGSVLERVLAQ